MNFIRNLKLRTKILTLVGLLIIALLGLAVANTFTINQVAQGGSQIFDNNLRSVQYTLTAQSAFVNLSAAVYLHILADSPSEYTEYEQVIQAKDTELREALANFEALALGVKEKELLAQV